MGLQNQAFLRFESNIAIEIFFKRRYAAIGHALSDDFDRIKAF